LIEIEVRCLIALQDLIFCEEIV